MPINDKQDDGSYSYNKLLAVFNKNGGDTSQIGRAYRADVFLQNHISYEDSVAGMHADTYKSAAGCDLSAIFMPYESVVGSGGNLPGFHSSVNPSGSTSGTAGIYELLPFRW